MCCLSLGAISDLDDGAETVGLEAEGGRHTRGLVSSAPSERNDGPGLEGGDNCF
jgi:hypothetical protein